MKMLQCYGEELPDNPCSNPLGNDRKNEITVTSGQNGVSSLGEWAQKLRNQEGVEVESVLLCTEDASSLFTNIGRICNHKIVNVQCPPFPSN